ncbi:hypothetical protein Dform_01277 [Dehalogenimonas formicexedens]|uniref:Uncharacterized protein n=1 Tax=Dehalogenimonas formicexedens TaxID=1839801 RepID=A0A1P8F831_9CHLR|nr:hypothetical protein [Dehalogenimonas formicexedens]APV44605.1 hypothetical protein Dform_01277 [Dehalogenimonas formicexedens]
MLDSELRYTMINNLKELERDIINRELPIATRGVEIFGKSGEYIDENKKRYWIAAYISVESKSDVERIHSYLADYGSTKNQ